MTKWPPIGVWQLIRVAAYNRFYCRGIYVVEWMMTCFIIRDASGSWGKISRKSRKSKKAILGQKKPFFGHIFSIIKNLKKSENPGISRKLASLYYYWVHLFMDMSIHTC